MDTGLDRVLARAATIDELLSDAYRPLSGQQGDADLAARRLAAWCSACASGDRSLFARRLARDGLTPDEVLARFATVEGDRLVSEWGADAEWVAAVLGIGDEPAVPEDAAVAFGDLLAPVVDEAQRRMWADLAPQVRDVMTDGAHADMRHALVIELSDLAAPALFARFIEARGRGAGYRDFISEMRATGFRRLIEDEPVLLRLMASLTRQWIETSRELLTRLSADLPSIRRDLLGSDTDCRVAAVKSRLSDPHNFGRTVAVLDFEDGCRVVYKPKDLSVDAAWARLVDRLNEDAAPVDLRAMRVLACTGYGWTEFIEHAGCTDAQDFRQFYRRAGAWLALFHVFVGVDMHQENIVATASHPVPIDLEMILQPPDTRLDSADDSGQAFVKAMRKVLDSVLTVGLLPAYGRHSASEVFVIGGVHSNASPRVTVRWTDVNTDTMHPVREQDTAPATNLPFVGDHRASLGDHLDELMSGFADYARFLRRHSAGELLDDFTGLAVRTVIRPTRFYTGLLGRLRDHRTMDDGVIWSAQADFTARLADWESDSDPGWPTQRAERASLTDLNVPHFTTVADTARADARLRGLGDSEIDWQIELIGQNTGLLRPSPDRGLPPLATATDSAHHAFIEQADALAAVLAEHSIREGSGAAWIGLDWLGDSEVSQLVVLGPDLYNGNCGVALFLAAHAAVTGETSSETLARAALAALRRNLHGRNPARMARSLGVGGGLGLGSIVYGLAVIAYLLGDEAVARRRARCGGVDHRQSHRRRPPAGCSRWQCGRHSRIASIAPADGLRGCPAARPEVRPAAAFPRSRRPAGAANVGQPGIRQAAQRHVAWGRGLCVQPAGVVERHRLSGFRGCGGRMCRLRERLVRGRRLGRPAPDD